jgi:hypothetical protein
VSAEHGGALDTAFNRLTTSSGASSR